MGAQHGGAVGRQGLPGLGNGRDRGRLAEVRQVGQQRRCRRGDGRPSAREQRRRVDGDPMGEQGRDEQQQPPQPLAALVARHRHVGPATQGVADERGQVRRRADLDEEAGAVVVQLLDGVLEQHRPRPLLGGQVPDRRGVGREPGGARAGVQRALRHPDVEPVEMGPHPRGELAEPGGVVGPAEVEPVAHRSPGGEVAPAASTAASAPDSTVW